MRAKPRQLATAVLLLISLMLAPVAALAQGQNGDWSRVTSIPTGSKLEVKLKSGKTLKGTLRSVSDATLWLTAKNAPVEVRREEISTVHEVTKKSAKKATLIGMGVGAGVGAAAGAISDANDNSGFEFDKLDTAVTAGLAVLGAGAGALAGFLVGRSGSKRVLVYEAK